MYCDVQSVKLKKCSINKQSETNKQTDFKQNKHGIGLGERLDRSEPYITKSCSRATTVKKITVISLSKNSKLLKVKKDWQLSTECNLGTANIWHFERD